MIEHQASPWHVLLVELGVGSLGGHVAHTAAGVPAWLGGGLSALCVGVLLRVLDAPLRRLSERLARRISRPPPAPRTDHGDSP